MCCIFWIYIYHFTLAAIHFKELTLHVMFDLNIGLRKHVLINQRTVYHGLAQVQDCAPCWTASHVHFYL